MMRIRSSSKPTSYIIWLSAQDTYDWANKAGACWPCSELAGNRIMAGVNENGLYEFTINGKCDDIDCAELIACIADHLPERFRHLWPVWESK